MSVPLRLSRPGPPVVNAARAVVREAPPPPPATEFDVSLVQATAQSLAVAVIEIFHGQRRTASIARWVQPDLLARLAQHATTRRTLSEGKPVAARLMAAGSPRLCVINETLVEAVVVVRTSTRCRGVGMRLELRSGRWLLTAISTV